jgi:hypothetical protein
MKKRGFDPSDRTFTILLNSLAINASASPNSVSRARALYAQIQEHPDLDPTTVHTNALLKVCARQRDYTALQEVYDSMSKRGGGRGASSSSSGRDGNAPDVITYSTMINAYARKGGDEGFEAAWKVWEDCLEAKTTKMGAEDVELDTQIVDGILLACREAESAVFMKRGYKLVESLYGFPASSSSSSTTSPSVSGTASGSGAGVVSATERAISPSKHLGLAPAMLRKDTIHPRTVELVLSICSKLKDYNRAKHYMTLIRTTFPDFKPDPQLLSSLMYLQTANKQYDEAIASWDEISQLGLPHTPGTFKQGLDAAVKARNWEKTLEMYTLMRTLITKNKTLSPPDHRLTSLVNPIVRNQDAWTLVSTLKCAVKTNHLQEGLEILRESRWTKVVQNPQYPRANVDLANLVVKILGGMLKSNKEALDICSVASSAPGSSTTSTGNGSSSSSSSSNGDATETGPEAYSNSPTPTLTKTTDTTAKHTREMERLKRELTDAKAIQTRMTTTLADHDAGKAAQKESEDANRLRNRQIRIASSLKRRGYEGEGQGQDQDHNDEGEREGGNGGGWRKVSEEEYSSSRNNNYSKNGSSNSYNSDSRHQKPWMRKDSTKPRKYQRDGGDNRSPTPADDPFKPTTRFIRTFNE